jgi:RNA polymerase sigma-70 factor (ECF subfamily)
MYRIAYAVLHDEGLAEDAVSEAFIRIINKLHKLHDCRSPKTKSYIVKVIKSTSINIYRKNKRQYNQEIPIDEAMQIADKTQELETSEKIESLLVNLNDTDKRIISLRYKEDMSWKEVADILSLTEANVRKRFERVKKRLSMKGEINNE